ncbi:MAG: insulinase family protein [Syntrophobacterales bacterium]|nr:insulinase family protein [Syntrophobacterales bacterium]
MTARFLLQLLLRPFWKVRNIFHGFESGTLNLKPGTGLTVTFIAASITVAAPAYAFPPVERFVLPNKLKVIVAEEHSLPFATLQLLVDSGSRKDPPGKEGLARLTAQGLLLGTEKRTAEAINRELDFLGASLGAAAGPDYAVLSLRVLKKDLDRGFDLFMDVLTRPVFPADEVGREVEKTLAAIQSEEDQPDVVAEKAFQKELYLSGYGHPAEGTKESLPTVVRGDVERFYRENYFPNNAILVVAGDVTVAEVRARLLPLLDAWKAGDGVAVPFKSAFAEGPKTVKINRSITQANIVIGHAGVSRDNPDYYAVVLMNYILGGGGFSSRLFDEIRVKRGLAYSVGSFFDARRYPGSFQVSIQTKNSSAREAIRIVLDQMKLIQASPVKVKELDGAKKYLTGSFPIRMDTQAKLAGFLAQVEYFGLGLDYPSKYPSLILAVAREKIQDVAKRYLYPDKCIVVIVADLKEAGLDAPGLP